MKFRHFFIILLGTSLLFSCTLSTKQETQLNANMNEFIIIRNDGDALSFMNFTHPIIVKYYQSKGPLLFKKKFQEIPRIHEQNNVKSTLIYWDKGYIKNSVANDSLIQARIEISLIKNDKAIDSTTFYYAITTKDASNWTFVSQEDYFSVFPEDFRLFSN